MKPTSPHITAGPPPDRLLMAAAGLASLLAWVFVALFMIGRGLLFASGDDFSRTVISMLWGRNWWLFVDGYYWLPLPFWYYGAWHWLLGWTGLVHWFIPGATLMMALASWGLLLLTYEVNGSEEYWRSRARRLRAGAFCAALPLVLSIPVGWRLTATTLAEPVFIAAAVWMTLVLVRLSRRPTRLRYAALLALALALSWTRYEGWALGAGAWLLGCLYGVGVQPRRRLALALAAGWAPLAILPVTLMFIHADFYGDPLHFLEIPRMFSRMTPEITEASTLWRVGFLTRLAAGQGVIVLALLPIGLWHGRRVRELQLLVLVALLAWLTYYQAAFSNTVGFNPRTRFAVPALWLSVPLAARGLAVLPRLRPGVLGWGLLALVAAAGVARLAQWDGRQWGGLVHAPHAFELAEELGREARERGAKAVIDEPRPMGDDINLLRIYMGLDQVVVAREWLPPDLPHDGPHYYFTPRELPGRSPWRSTLGQNIYLLDRWPIAN